MFGDLRMSVVSVVFFWWGLFDFVFFPTGFKPNPRTKSSIWCFFSLFFSLPVWLYTTSFTSSLCWYILVFTMVDDVKHVIVDTWYRQDANLMIICFISHVYLSQSIDTNFSKSAINISHSRHKIPMATNWKIVNSELWCVRLISLFFTACWILSIELNCIKPLLIASFNFALLSYNEQFFTLS